MPDCPSQHRQQSTQRRGSPGSPLWHLIHLCAWHFAPLTSDKGGTPFPLQSKLDQVLIKINLIVFVRPAEK